MTVAAVTPGIHQIPEAQYHADELADRPSLSASIAFLLCNSSPAHARQAHPRLTREYKREEKDAYDVGTVAHAMFLEGRDAVEIIDAENWRTNAAKEARDAARAAGRIPLLPHTYADVEAMVNAAKEQLAALHIDPPLFQDGLPERTLVWEEDGLICRARLDWLRNGHRIIDDLKTTSRSANPETFTRNLFTNGYDVKAAFYIRGVRALTGITPDFRWAVVETEPPHVLSVVAPAPDLLAHGHQKVERAVELWRRCLETGKWPGYEPLVHYAHVPAYEETRWLERVALLEAA